MKSLSPLIVFATLLGLISTAAAQDTPDVSSLGGVEEVFHGTVEWMNLDSSTGFGPCDGQFSDYPNHVITLSNPHQALSLELSSSEEVALVVQGADFLMCADNALTSTAVLSGRFEAGVYWIWIGARSGENDYELRVGPQSLELAHLGPQDVPNEAVDIVSALAER